MARSHLGLGNDQLRARHHLGLGRRGGTRAKMMEILKVNPVVKGKVEKECERVLALGSKCLMGGTEKVAALDVLGAERVILKNKTIALSDLLAVYRAL